MDGWQRRRSGRLQLGVPGASLDSLTAPSCTPAEEEKRCVCCWSAAPTEVLTACGHANLCKSCLDELQAKAAADERHACCPSCRAYVLPGGRVTGGVASVALAGAAGWAKEAVDPDAALAAAAYSLLANHYKSLYAQPPILTGGSGLSVFDADGWTPLHWAADVGALYCVQMLLDHGADADARDTDGDTPLIVAVDSQRPEATSCALLLLERGAGLALRNTAGETAIDVVVKAHAEAVRDCNGELAEAKLALVATLRLRAAELVEQGEATFAPVAASLCCNKCDAVFSELDALTEHQSTHKRFECDEAGCGYGTSHSGNLKRHKSRHTGKRPFQCDFLGCDYSSAQSDNLKRHKSRHTGVRPFPCAFRGCDYSSAQSDNLSRHKKTCKLRPR